MANDENPASFDVDPELLADFITESREAMDSIDNDLVKLETHPQDKPCINAVFRVVHSIKGNAGFFNLNAVRSIAHKTENLLDEARQERIQLGPQSIALLFRGVDLLREAFKRAESKTPTEAQDIAADYFQQLEAFLKSAQSSAVDTAGIVEALSKIQTQLTGIDHPNAQAAREEAERLRSILLAPPPEAAQAPAAGTPESSAAEKTQSNRGQEAKTMRVSEATVDGFMTYVGELIMASEVFNYLQKKVEYARIDTGIVKEFKNANLSFNLLSQNLQKNLMEIRKIPMKTLTSKAPRLVRDLAKDLQKKVKFEVIGEETLADKSLLEAMEDPFVHLLRNSLDHGLETPEDRKRAGKDETGLLRVTARCDRDFLYLDIEDDGKGIDPARIREAAVKKGLLTAERAQLLSNKEAVELIFLPGFSSAAEVSQVSGRGVGMDVVLTNVKKVNGSIQVESTPGVGTCVHVKLPLAVTLIVVSGLVVTCGPEQFVIPLENVREVAELSAAQVSTMQGRTEIVRLRDRVFPLVRLASAIGQSNNAREHDSLMVVVEKDGASVGLVVEKLLGLQQVVLKNIGAEFKRVRTVLGGAILGDGCVALVLDIKGLVSRYSQGHEQQEEPRAS